MEAADGQERSQVEVNRGVFTDSDATDHCYALLALGGIHQIRCEPIYQKSHFPGAASWFGGRGGDGAMQGDVFLPFEDEDLGEFEFELAIPRARRKFGGLQTNP